MTQEQQNRPPGIFAPPSMVLEQPEENRIWKKMKDSPVVPLATLGFLGIAGYRVYTARQRGGMKLSFFLIHTRLAAQGFGVAALGSLVLYSLGKRGYDSLFGNPAEAIEQQPAITESNDEHRTRKH